MRISVTISQTLNIGQFSNVKPGITIEDEIQSEETPAEARTRLSTVAKELWIQEALDQLKIARDLGSGDPLDTKRLATQVAKLSGLDKVLNPEPAEEERGEEGPQTSQGPLIPRVKLG